MPAGGTSGQILSWGASGLIALASDVEAITAGVVARSGQLPRQGCLDALLLLVDVGFEYRLPREARLPQYLVASPKVTNICMLSNWWSSPGARRELLRFFEIALASDVEAITAGVVARRIISPQAHTAP